MQQLQRFENKCAFCKDTFYFSHKYSFSYCTLLFDRDIRYSFQES